MENWSRIRKLGTAVLLAGVSYFVGWFWIVFLGNPVGNIDKSDAGNVIIIALLGAILGSLGVIALALATCTLLIAVGIVINIVVAPHQLFRHVQRVGVRVLGGWVVNLVAVGIAVGVLYLLGGWSSSREPGLMVGAAVFEWIMLMVLGVLSVGVGALVGGILFGLPLAMAGAVWEKWAGRPTPNGAVWWMTKISYAAGAVGGVWYLLKDQASSFVVVGSLSSIRIISVVVAYLGLVYGLHRASRWVRETGRLIPDIGISIHAPEEFWSPQPVLAWRSWQTSPKGLIGAWGGLWTGPERSAKCPKVWHKAPEWKCSCGIYGLKEPPDASRAADVIGLVELSGRVVEHADGYRAEKARVIQLWADRERASDQLEGLRPQMPGVIIQKGRPTRNDEERWRY